MPEEISNPLLSLIKEQSLIDDLQYEEVLAEFKRSGKPVLQILQDFGVMDLDTILQIIADNMGTQVVSFRDREFPQELVRSITAHPARIDELGFIVKKDIQMVVADPAQVEKAIEKYYPEDSESVSEILKELGADEEIAKEVREVAATDNAALMTGLANEAPIVRFVNLV